MVLCESWVTLGSLNSNGIDHFWLDMKNENTSIIKIKIKFSFINGKTLSKSKQSKPYQNTEIVQQNATTYKYNTPPRRKSISSDWDDSLNNSKGNEYDDFTETLK